MREHATRWLRPSTIRGLTPRAASEPQTKGADHERAYHLRGNRCAQGRAARDAVSLRMRPSLSRGRYRTRFVRWLGCAASSRGHGEPSRLGPSRTAAFDSANFLPPVRPRARAALSPARVRSRISSRSNSVSGRACRRRARRRSAGPARRRCRMARCSRAVRGARWRGKDAKAASTRGELGRRRRRRRSSPVNPAAAVGPSRRHVVFRFSGRDRITPLA